MYDSPSPSSRGVRVRPWDCARNFWALRLRLGPLLPCSLRFCFETTLPLNLGLLAGEDALQRLLLSQLGVHDRLHSRRHHAYHSNPIRHRELGRVALADGNLRKRE